MCRSCDQGGRRCPGETPVKRRARQRAAYRATTAAKTPVTTPPGTPAPSITDGYAPSGSTEAVTTAIAHARAVLDNAGPLTTRDTHGWHVATQDGIAVETAIRSAGAAVAERATPRAEEIARAKMTTPGALVLSQEGGFESKDHYLDAVREAALEAKMRRRDNKLAYEEETGPIQERMAAAQTDQERQQCFQEWVDATAKYTPSQQDVALIVEEEAIRTGATSWDATYAQAHAEAYREVLAEQRAMGPGEGQALPCDEHSEPEAADHLRQALRYYPRDWIDRDLPATRTLAIPEEDGGGEYTGPVTLRVISSDERPHYDRGTVTMEHGRATGAHATVVTSTRDYSKVETSVAFAAHEYGHHQESAVTPEINAVCQSFLARRTTSEDGSRHRLIRYNAAQTGAVPETAQELSESRAEWVRPDSFVDSYVGKNIAAEGTSEVFTTGIESLTGGRYGGLRGAGDWEFDAEHRDLTVGLLASLR